MLTDDGPVDDSPAEGIPVRIIPQTPEEQEAHARGLPLYRVPLRDTRTWRRWDTEIGVQLLLPATFELDSLDAGNQQLWHSPEGSRFFITRHEGDGLSTTSIGFDSEPGPVHQEGRYSIQIAGRWAVLHLFGIADEVQEVHFALVDVAIRNGFGLGVAVEAVSSDRRTELITSISTIVNTD